MNKIIKVSRKRTVYICHWCFEKFRSRYGEVPYVNSSVAVFCSDACELRYVTDDVDPQVRESNGWI